MADEDVDGATGVSNGGGHREMFRAVHRGPWRKHGLSSNVVALITSDRGQVRSTTAGTGKRSSGGRCDRKDRLSWGWHCAFLLLARDLTTWTILQDDGPNPPHTPVQRAPRASASPVSPKGCAPSQLADRLMLGVDPAAAGRVFYYEESPATPSDITLTLAEVEAAFEDGSIKPSTR